MPSAQLWEILIVAAVVAVVFYNLYAVLGRRIGRQPGESPGAAPARPAVEAQAQAKGAAAPEVELTGLAALKARDADFDIDKFLQGARGAYQMIVRAFAAGDRATLKGLLSPQVMDGFEHAMAEREAAGRTESIEFEHDPRADVEDSELDGDLARIKVRFLAEFKTHTTGPDGESADERRTAETWTFERNLNSRDPNWTLIRVDAAQA